MDRVYVYALEFLIFSFVGSELAETDGCVADLPARDNIGCCQCNLSSFYLFIYLFIKISSRLMPLQ
jgi:hypothetical protein